MNTHEQRIREFAYQIWESEGKPHGQTERHWDMARKLAETHAASEQQEVAGSTEPAPSVEPITPISPTQPAQPVPASDPIQPTDPVQPSQPNAAAIQTDADAAKPVKAKRLRTKAADKAAAADAAPTKTVPVETASAPIIAEQTKKPGRLKKAKKQENETA